MKKHLQSVAEVTFYASVIVALNPLIDFLVAPPAEKAGRWAVTVIALGCAAALRLYLHAARKSQTPAQEG